MSSLKIRNGLKTRIIKVLKVTMTTQRDLLINIKNVELGQITQVTSKYNTNHATCTSYRPTSAQLRCKMHSNLGKLKLVKDINFPFDKLNFYGFKTKIDFKLDNEYFIEHNLLSCPNSASSSRTIQFDANFHWQLYDNTIEDYVLSSNDVTNKNSMEAEIPPSNCFNLTVQDTLNTVTISYLAAASMIAYQDGIPLSGSELQSLANNINNNNTVNNIEITTPIIGSITFSVVVSDTIELSPCE